MLIVRLAILAALPGLAAAQFTNVAPTGTASQSSTSNGGLPARAIDGNTDGVWGNGSVTHTGLGVNEWWEVALPSIAVVHEIWLWNRANCCTPPRLSNFKVTAFLGTAAMFTATHPGTVPQGNYARIDLGIGTVCDRVRIEHLGTTAKYLSLAEVEIRQYHQPIMNLARLGIATQSSTRPLGGAASRAIDGNYNRVFTKNSITHTQDPGTVASWWQVQLPWVSRIDQVKLYNRGDCCGDRLSNFRVSVFIQNLEVFGMDYFPTTGSVPQGREHVINLPVGTVGDRVRVALLGPNRHADFVLSLAEVEVNRFGASLTPDVIEIKSTAGSTQTLALDGGRQHAGQIYLLLGSLTGTSPGITLGGVNTPLNYDPYFQWTLTNPNFPPLTNSRAALDNAGRAQAGFVIPPGVVPNLIGLHLYHAFAIVGTTTILDAASNAVLVKIVQ
jgi:hypothetical protein